MRHAQYFYLWINYPWIKQKCHEAAPFWRLIPATRRQGPASTSGSAPKALLAASLAALPALDPA